jgi:hypothetical protein
MKTFTEWMAKNKYLGNLFASKEEILAQIAELQAKAKTLPDDQQMPIIQQIVKLRKMVTPAPEPADDYMPGVFQ